jgi:hypothetical protein
MYSTSCSANTVGSIIQFVDHKDCADRVQCIVLFPWVFIATGLLSKWYGTWTPLYGIVNLGLAITIAMGISMQAQFLPASSSSCKWGKAVDWQVVDGYPSFFTLTAKLDTGDENKAEAICKNMVSGWMLAVTAA